MGSQLTGDQITTFLVVDPEHSLAKVIRGMLLREFRNARVHMTSNCSDALALFHGERIDFILSEVDLPLRAGVEFIGAIRAEDKTVPFIYISSRSQQELIILAAQYDSDGFIIKPFTAGILIETVKEAWRRRKSVITSDLNRLEELAESDPEQALEELADRYGSDEQRAKVFTLRARILRRLGRLVEAKGALEHAVAVNPFYIVARKELGDVMLELGDGDEAKRLYAQVVDVSPFTKDCHLPLVRLYVADGEHDELKSLVERYHACWPESNQLQMTAAEELLSRGDNDLATEFFKQAIAIDKKASTIDIGALVYLYSRLGVALRRQGRTEEAIECYLEALALEPENAAVHYNLGVACIISGQFRRATEAFDTALKIAPDFEEARQGREQLAVELRKRASS